MSTTDPQPSEEELRAAYEAEIKKIRIEQVLLEHVVSLVNLGMRRTGLAPGTEDERDPGQVGLAIEAVKVLLPLLEQSAPAQIPAIRDALSQLQLAFVKIGGEQPSTTARPAAGRPGGDERGQDAASGGGSSPETPDPGQPGPAQSSGRLWIPGQ